VFPPSKMNSENSVATRYFARESNGKMKVRGMMIRKRDTPKYVKDFQEAILSLFSQKDSVEKVNSTFSDFKNLYEIYLSNLLSNKVQVDQLIIRKYISRSLEDYKANNSSKIVLQQLAEDNLSLIGGERIEYLVSDLKHSDIKKRYTPFHRFDGKLDLLFYKKLLEEAFWELLEPFFPRESSLF
jgi:DNA polymerase elongation subunit (family B)